MAEKREDIRIAVLAPYAVYPSDAGGKQDIRLLSEALARRVSLQMISVAQPDAAAKFPLHPILGKSRLRYINPLLVFRIARFIRREKITHLLMEHPYFGWLAWIVRKLTGIKLIVRSQNIEAQRFRGFGKWWWRIMHHYEKLVHRSADLNLWITEDDMDYATDQYKVPVKKSLFVPYGTERNGSPSTAERSAAAGTIRTRYQISSDKLLLLFNGSFNYSPNIRAFDFLMYELLPYLRKAGFQFHLMVFGGKLSDDRIQAAKAFADMTYTGFVDDPERYYMAADVFVNPVIDGGGIKTKLVEALATNVSAVSHRLGATGVTNFADEHKFVIVEKQTPAAYHQAFQRVQSHADISPAFYLQYGWDALAEKILQRVT